MKYRMFGNFRGSNFWELRLFRGFIFLWHTYCNHLAIYSKFSWISRAREIHKNLNPMKITNHTWYSLKKHLTKYPCHLIDIVGKSNRITQCLSN